MKINALEDHGSPQVNKSWRIIEFLTLFVIVPFCYTFLFRNLPLFLVLFVIYVICLSILLADKTFDRGQLWWNKFSDWKRVLMRFLSIAIVIVILLWIARPESFFIIAREQPLLMVVIFFFYPIFSAYPQELAFRTFYFHRYNILFPNRQSALWINAILFGYAHLLFDNWIAVVATILLGWALASTYLRTRSLLGTTLEHALYGNFAFLIGIGDFFYKFP